MAKILLVEDSALMRETLRQMLEIEGYTVIEADDGPTGIALARTEKPDLMILDLMMPYMSGTQVVEYMQSDPLLRGLPIIVLTAVSRPDQVMSVLELSVRDYLLKPVNQATLRKRVQAVLSGAMLNKRREGNQLWDTN